jgi:hypothetical protein
MITLRASCFQYDGKGQFIARIHGRDSKFVFDREFIGRKEGRRGITTTADVDDPGLYELREISKKGDKLEKYKLVVEYDDELYALRAMGDSLDESDGKEAAMKIAKYLEKGCRFDDIVQVEAHGKTEDGRLLLYYRIRDINEQKKADKIHSIEQAEQECWSSLKDLSLEQSWEVTKKLRERIKQLKSSTHVYGHVTS